MSDEEKKLAKEIVDELMTRIYSDIGKSVTKKIFWVLVALGIGAAGLTGIIHFPGGK